MLLAFAAVSSEPYSPPVRSTALFWSIAGVAETDGEDRTLYGAAIRYMAYEDDHAPPFAAAWEVSALGGDGQTVLRGTGTFCPLAFPMGIHASFWLRPLVGVEYRREEPDDGFGALVTIGGEFIFQPKGTCQVALTLDRLFSTLGTSNQAGVAFRWGRRQVKEKPNHAVQPPHGAFSGGIGSSGRALRAVGG